MRPTFAAFRIKIAEKLNAEFKPRSVRELSDKLKNLDNEGETIAIFQRKSDTESRGDPKVG